MAARPALINVMATAAGKAARGLVRDFGEVENLQVSRKGTADFVSEADNKAEYTIYKELKKARPNFGFLMEEKGFVSGSDKSNKWIVDPLDGTTNFLHGLPHFSISIALERDNDIYAGLIYEPVNDQMFWAEKGSGAFLNNRRLRVSNREDLSECMFATGIPFAGKEGHEPFLGQLKDVMAVSAGVRRMGSAALDLAYTAAGRFDGYWEQGINAWDMAAGIIIMREAGGVVTDFKGGNEMMKTGSIIATNTGTQTSLRKILSKSA